MKNRTPAAKANYYIQCIIRGNTNTRAADNCLEDGDARQVSAHILKRATTQLPPLVIPTGRLNGKEHEDYRKLHTQWKTKKAIVDFLHDQGIWSLWHWLSISTENTYANMPTGYTPSVIVPKFEIEYLYPETPAKSA